MVEPSRPRLDLESLTRKLSGLQGEFQERISMREAAPAEPWTASSAPYVFAAAVLTQFDPTLLAPVPPAVHDAEGVRCIRDYSQLGLDENRATRWTLRHEVRKRALQQLATTGGIAAALEANPEHSAGRDDVFQRTFRAVLLSTLPPPPQLDEEELSAVVRVHEWVEGVVPIRPLHEYRQRLELLKLLAPFRHLTSHQEGGRWVDHFQGRETELTKLRRYAGVLEKNLADTVGSLLSINSLREKPPLLIYGPGGMGKSTLLAKFLMQHAEAVATDLFPFVYLDFDRPGITAQEPITLLIEAARQLDVQYPAGAWFQGRDSFDQFRQRWQERLARRGEVRPGTPTTEEARDAGMRRRQRTEAVEEFAKVYQSLAPVKQQPLLFVLDTFEEVQYRSRDRVRQIYRLLNSLQSRVPFLRTVVAGRTRVEEFKTEPLELRGLDTRAAHGFLALHGVSDPAVAEVVIRHVGGNPLTLRLAADLLRQEGSLQELTDALTPERRLLVFRQRFQETEIQGRLYRRILGHLHHPDVRKLAHPGLVLRQITAELIRDVLAGPCEVDVAGEHRAEELFGELAKEVALVTQTVEGVLKPRSDVRRAMLDLMRQDRPDQTREIQQAAVRYYAERPGVGDRAEEIYHRLALNESPRSVDERWIPGVEASLEESVSELPPQAQAYLAARIGLDLPDEVWAAADLVDRTQHTARRVRELIEMGHSAAALDLVREGEELAEGSPLADLESIAQEQVRTEQQANQGYSEAL